MDDNYKDPSINTDSSRYGDGASAPGQTSGGSQLMMKGVTVLAIAGIISKIFGGIFRIPLTNMIGAEGQSYYGGAYPIYQFFYVIAVAGFPLAISKMVSERAAHGDYINAQKTLRLALKATTVVCIISFIILFFGAGMFAGFYKNPGAELSIKAISFAILFTSVVASLRGYFQGMQNMTPHAVSEVLEQFVRVITGLGLAYLFYRTDLEKAAAGATFGASAGIFVTMLLLIYLYRKDRPERVRLAEQSIIREESDRDRFREMLNIIVPVVIGSSIMPVILIIDNAIIMRRLLATGWSLQEAKTLYGLISGYCDPLVNLPVLFIEAVCISLLPAVSSSFTLGNKSELRDKINIGLKTMMIITYPCSIGLISLAGPILHLLYPSHPEEADMSVPTLVILSLAIISLSSMRILSTSLQGIDKMRIPVRNLSIGAVVKVFMTYTLAGIPALNIKGAAFGSLATYTIASILNYAALRKHGNIRIDFRETYIKPLFSSLVMGISAVISYKLVFMLIQRNSLATLAAIIVAVLVYFALVFKTGTLTREEMELIPKGDTLYKIACKMHLAK